MKFGVSLIMRGKEATPEAFFALARQAETLGYDSLWCSDHIFFPKFTQSYPNTPHGGVPPTWIDGYWDCMTVLNQVAARTQRIRIGTSVLILPMHHPMDTEDTFCPHCGRKVIERVGFRVTRNDVVSGECRHCRGNIDGVWN